VRVPKVSNAHLAARREQIVDAATARFAVNGFQATGMADIIGATGLSAGAVYRYFRSKDDLIEAIVGRVLGRAAERFEVLLADGSCPRPADAVRVAVETVYEFAAEGDVDVTRVAIQAWAEAIRNERVHGIAGDAYRKIRGFFLETVRRTQAAGEFPADVDPEPVAAALFSLVIGFMLQRLLLGDVDPATYGAGVTALFGAGAASAHP